MTQGDILSGELFLQSIGIVGLLFAQIKASPAEPAAPPDARPKSPADETLERLRRQHSVCLIEKKDEGLGVDAVPPGTYGWSFAPAAVSPLFANRAFQSFEMHKAADGAGYLIGYVTVAEKSQLDSAPAELNLKLFPEPHAEATELVSLPLHRVHAKKVQPSREGGNWLPLIVQPGE